MLGWTVLLFALYLSAALVSPTRPGEGERRGAMVGFGLLVPAAAGQGLPPPALALVTLYFALYLRKTRSLYLTLCEHRSLRSKCSKCAAA